MTLGLNTYGVIYRVMYLLENNMDGHIATAGTYTESSVRGSQPRAIVHIYTLLWRYLTGDDDFDVDYYLTRLEGRADLVEGRA